ncbi:MAG: GGDEF domain-containing protein [Chloroflexi bacterium]|nr:GGDEF domain-containing protein [Chloroflexota bacterium]
MSTERMGNTELDAPPPIRVPSKVRVQAQQRIASLTRWQGRLQGGLMVVGYVLSLVWLQIPQLPVAVQAFGVWVILAVLLALLVMVSRRSARRLAALYRKALDDLEQEVHDLSFRETTSTIVDQMTRVYTYDYLATRIHEELDRARRYTRPVTLILVDLVQFRDVNEHYGRVQGNQVLRRFAQNILRPSVRSHDVVARYGGDEFAILLPETDTRQALTVAQRLVERARRGTLLPPDGRRLPLPITCGLASYPDDGTTAEELAHAAEAALLQAKHTDLTAAHAPGEGSECALG